MPTLNWLNRDQAVLTSARIPYRLLEEIPHLSYGDPKTENMIIHGDNLETLKALLPYYSGKVKCIYIDPPYNTGSALEHYDDNVEHSLWLTLLYPRLELLRELLLDGGSIWVSIDDNEVHYLKVLMDEIFGRKNFVTTFVWQQRKSRENRRVFSNNHEYILLYSTDIEKFAKSRNSLDLSEKLLKRFKNPDNDPRGPWQSVSANAQAGHGTHDQFYDLQAPNGMVHKLPKGRCWLYTKKRMNEEIAKGNIWFGKKGNGVPRIKKFLSETNKGLTPETLWLADEVGTNDNAKKELIKVLSDGEVFDTPKPESLIQRILHIASNPGDLVLDSFLGSGTTAAVAQKMGRRYIGIEMGEHAVTHCVPRLRKVIDGEKGGISTDVNWDGGGGFRFYQLGEAIFNEDGVLQKSTKFETLAAHIWFTETHKPLISNIEEKSPFLGENNGIAYYLLFNGILGDRRPQNGNVLTSKLLSVLPPFDGPKVIFGEWTPLSKERLKRENIVFKQIPYDIKAR